VLSGGEGVAAQGVLSGRGEDGGDALPDPAEGGGGDQAGTEEVVGGGLVAAAAAVEEQVGLAAQLQLRPACRYGAQDGSVASAEGARGGHAGLRTCEAEAVLWNTFSLSTRFGVRTHRRGQERAALVQETLPAR